MLTQDLATQFYSSLACLAVVIVGHSFVSGEEICRPRLAEKASGGRHRADYFCPLAADLPVARRRRVRPSKASSSLRVSIA